MSNILKHNRLPLECKLSYKDYWDFYLRIGRVYHSCKDGLQTECLSAYIDTTFDECLNRDGSLQSLNGYAYEGCRSSGVELKNFGLTSMDNGRITYYKNLITPEQFNNLLKSSLTIESGDCGLHLFPVNGNNNVYTYDSSITTFNGIKCLELAGGFYQGFFKANDGCDYSVLPSDIGNGLSFEFELYHKDLDVKRSSFSTKNLNNKGIFFYIGTRAENKWIRYYHDACSESDDIHETTDLETSDGVKIDEYIPELTESDNKFLIYSRTCGGKTVLNGGPDESVLVETSNIEYDDNLFTVFSRKCGGITTDNFKEDYLKEHPTNKYNIYEDLWNNALAFRITDDNRIGYKYLVKDCNAENPSCSYKIESEYSNENNVPYAEWTAIHVRILPCGSDEMRLMFYVDGRLVLYSKELPRLNLRQLKDLPEKQEGVPFNISLGGGTQGLCDVVYEDYLTYHKTSYPLENEFGGSFVGYIKSFKFYSCSLNYTQIQQNINKELKNNKELKIYCGAIVFNTRPSKTPITEQSDIIQMLNEYNTDVHTINIRLLPDISKRYIRLVVAIPSETGFPLLKVTDSMCGLENTEIGSEYPEITQFFACERMSLDGIDYDVYHYTYGSRPKYNNNIEFTIR